MSDLEEALRAAMVAADAAGPDPAQFRFHSPVAPVARRAWTLVAAAAAAACVIAVAIVAVAVTRGGSHKRDTISAPPPSLVCPSTPPTAVAPTRSYPLPAPRKEAITLSDRLAPSATPVHATVCAYVRRGSTRPNGSSARLIDQGLANLAELISWIPPGAPGTCTLNLALTDGDVYLLGLTYRTGTLWISAPDDHCLGASNGRFTTPTHLATTIKAALDAGAWPKPAPPAPCTGVGGRLGQQQQMVPPAPTGVTLCIRNGYAAPTVRDGTAAQLRSLVAALNDLPHGADGRAFKCALPDLTPAVSYFLTFTYKVGPPVIVTIFEPCNPAVHNGNLQATDADALQPILSQILNNRPAVTPAGAPVPATSTPTPRIIGPVCANGLHVTGAANGLATADANPTGLVSTWLPGMNSHTCKAETVSSGPDVASTIANEIRQAPQPYPGIRSCPMDDNTAVELVFSYASRKPEVIYVTLTGCASITAPGRSPRDMTEALRTELSAIAPPGWRVPH